MEIHGLSGYKWLCCVKAAGLVLGQHTTSPIPLPHVLLLVSASCCTLLNNNLLESEAQCSKLRRPRPVFVSRSLSSTIDTS